MYGPLQTGKAKPINLQFGYFGISPWPSDTGAVMRILLMMDPNEFWMRYVKFDIIHFGF